MIQKKSAVSLTKTKKYIKKINIFKKSKNINK